jgi:hypothetical protein
MLFTGNLITGCGSSSLLWFQLVSTLHFFFFEIKSIFCLSSFPSSYFEMTSNSENEDVKDVEEQGNGPSASKPKTGKEEVVEVGSRRMPAALLVFHSLRNLESERSHPVFRGVLQMGQAESGSLSHPTIMLVSSNPKALPSKVGLKKELKGFLEIRKQLSSPRSAQSLANKWTSE